MSLRRKRILIADGEVSTSRLFKLVLERQKACEVAELNRAAPALEVARQFKPEIISMDLLTPGRDASEVLHRVFNTSGTIPHPERPAPP